MAARLLGCTDDTPRGRLEPWKESWLRPWVPAHGGAVTCACSPGNREAGQEEGSVRDPDGEAQLGLSLSLFPSLSLIKEEGGKGRRPS